MNPYGYQPNTVYQPPYYQNPCGQSRGGSWVAIALVIFLLLVIIQFFVITKGSERVAEVAARFTLDAMPG